MCGILGTVGRVDEHAFAMALDSIKHRGPDACDTEHINDGAVRLGHVRLAIIDLSPAGKQPFTDVSGRYKITYNGELYNYLELKEELKTHYAFRTATDTEVVLAAFIVWGEACLTRMNGMFSLAIWDSKEQRLFAARDRLGEKPFYYAQRQGAFLFASEIKALLKFGDFKQNERLIAHYLYHGYYDHTDDTFFDGIRSLPPGHVLTYHDGRLTIRRYWDVSDTAKDVNPSIGLEEAGETLRTLLDDSIRLRFRSDVPVGINLSSGLDSGVLFSFARAQMGDTLHAFSMCSGHAAFNECSLIAGETLEGYDHTLWHQSSLTEDEVIRRMERMVRDQDQPYGGIPTVAYEKMMQLASETGITVLLEGQGVDEILAGYRYYAAELARDLSGSDGTPDDNRSQDATKLIEHSMLADEITKQIEGAPVTFPKPFDSHLLNAQYRDLRYTKLPRVLRFNDHASMTYAREVRQPYLDHRIVEFCFHLPHHLKINDGTQKFLMRSAFASYLKPSHRARAKVAFGAIQSTWLRTYGAAYLRVLLASESFNSRPYWKHEKVRERAEAFLRGEGDNSFFLWQCINLELWFRTYIDK